MTAFDRIERRLPEVLDDLGAPNIPDYFDDMLRADRPHAAAARLERP